MYPTTSMHFTVAQTHDISSDSSTELHPVVSKHSAAAYTYKALPPSLESCRCTRSRVPNSFSRVSKLTHSPDDGRRTTEAGTSAWRKRVRSDKPLAAAFTSKTTHGDTAHQHYTWDYKTKFCFPSHRTPNSR